MAKNITLPVYNSKGEVEKNLELNSKIMDVKVNDKLLTQSVRVYLTNQRQGTVSTKTRTEVTGSTRKIYKQKGTGRARHGSIKAPVFVGGGVAHGPKPKDYHLKLNKKQRVKALVYALNLKANEKNIFVLNNDLLKIEPKTKAFLTLLKQMKIDQEKVLLVLEKMENNNLAQAVRNLNKIDLIDVQSLNPYQLLRHNKILLMEKALAVLKIVDNEN